MNTKREKLIGIFGPENVLDDAQTLASYTRDQSFVAPRKPGLWFGPEARNCEEAAKVKEVYAKASEALIVQGAYFSRPYGAWADMVYSRDATATRVLRTVKHIVDPKNVMNPGKLCF